MRDYIYRHAKSVANVEKHKGRREKDKQKLKEIQSKLRLYFAGYLKF